MPQSAQKGQVLRAVRREKVGERARQVRQAGYIPAVLYGHGRPTLSLAVKGDEFLRIWEKVGTSTLFDLAVDDRTQKTLIYDVQYDPLTDRPIHVDFYAVREDEELETEVPLVFVGEAPAVVELGGTLVKNRDEVLVRALPANLPHEIKVDVSSLKTFDDVIRIKDLEVPARVELVAEGEEVVANVTPPRSEEELSLIHI